MSQRTPRPLLGRLLPASAVLASSVVVLATALAGPAAADPSPGSDGIGDDYFPLDGNGGIDVQHYAIDDAYDFSTGELTGTTTVDLTATQDLSQFNLDLLLPVSGVTVDGDDVGYEDQSGDHGHELVITPDQPIADGDTVTVVVDFAGDPDDYDYDPPSLTFPDGTGWLASGHEYVTMNEPHMAPWWFASNDHPLDKATYDISITADDDDQVISNGDLVSQGSAGAGLTTTTWRMDDPMASYLAFVAVGDFAVRTGTTAGLPWTYAVSRGASDTAGKDAKELGERSARVTAWLQDQVGEYPFSSTGGVTTALQSGFALENQTRPTYPGEPSRALMAHELGHQWFGDSVAVHGWKDIWLNEGFASYMANLYREDHGGVTTNQRLERSYQSLKDDDGFWQLDIADPGANDIFAGEVYTRGAMALEALRNKVGNRDMRKILRTWAADKEGGNGAVDEFTALAADVSGKDLTRFFQVWLSTPKAPKHTLANGFLKK